MADRDGTAESRSARIDGTISHNPQAANMDGGDDVASVLSSRMTDIASEDEGEPTQNSGTRSAIRHSLNIGEGSQRPNTGLSRGSSQRAAWSPASRRGPSTSTRTSMTGGIAGSTSNRPQSAASRSHVPSLTSHAFFRPMSSQRLQAQRGGSRQITQPGLNEDGSVDGASLSNQTIRQGLARPEELDQSPPSRGTEMTEQDTVGRLTANTSPTHGHNPSASLSDSVRPLQRNPANTKGLSLNIDKSYKSGGPVPMPSKSPHSFRSSFLLPSRGDPAPTSPNRSAQGREKLSSVASSPAHTPIHNIKQMPPKNLGSNYEYFTGNTIFCWGGRWQNTRHRPVNIATGILIIIPIVLFFVFSAPWLWHDISPAIPSVFAYVFCVCFSSFVHASVSDPGVSLHYSYT